MSDQVTLPGSGGEDDEPVPVSELDGLATLPVGPELCARLAQVGRSRSNGHQLVQQLRQWERLAAWVAAERYQIMAELADCPPGDAESPPVRGGGPDPADVAVEIGLALTLSQRAADIQFGFATALADRLPGTFAALRTGRISETKARVIVQGTTDLDDADRLARIEDRVPPRAPQQTAPQLRRTVERAMQAIAKDVLAERKRQREEGRRVHTESHGDGTGDVELCDLDLVDVVHIDALVSAYATAAKRGGDPRSRDQIRADTAVDLLTGRTTPPAVAELADSGETRPEPESTPASTRADAVTSDETVNDTASGDEDADDMVDDHTDQGEAATPDQAAAFGRTTVPREPKVVGTVRVTVPWDTLFAGGEQPGELGGFGPVAADTIRDLVGRLDRHQWCVTVTNPDTGEVSHAGSLGYQPSRALRDHVRARDGTCRIPGCHRPAERCELDHTLEWGMPGSMTCPCNLGSLCKRHHDYKTRSGATLEQPCRGQLPGGRCTGTAMPSTPTASTPLNSLRLARSRGSAPTRTPTGDTRAAGVSAIPTGHRSEQGAASRPAPQPGPFWQGESAVVVGSGS